jgi:iron complex transport system substrate-binding protein
MKRILFVIAISLIILASGLMGCTTEQETTVPEKTSIVDMVGRTVEIPTNIERVVCTFPPPCHYDFCFRT